MMLNIGNIDDLRKKIGSSTGTNLPSTGSNIKDLINSSTGSTGAIGSFTTSQIIEGICEGPIEGWPVASEPLKYIYLDGTPVKSYGASINIENIRTEFRKGTVDQTPLSQYSLIGSVKTPNWQAEIDDITKVGGSGPVIQQVQIRDDSDGAYPTVEAISFTITLPEGLYRQSDNGSRDATNCGIKIEINPKSDGSGAWVERVKTDLDQEVTSGGFDVTFTIELPPGWTIPYNLQGYSVKVDDIIQFRISKYNTEPENESAHNKVYLKNYSIHTRNQFSYPYTSLIGLTFDSKNFDGSIPSRMYELKLLKVKVPSNYTITTNDKTGEILERKYTGAWDGTFKEGFWTDNPVWCFYDLVTNSRYGLGKYVDSTLLNKWKLYEIAKYCDATQVVGSDSIFSVINAYGGVASAAGSSAVKEPRFTCNILISNREEAYSVVQRLASLFRSIVFFQQGGIQLIQDKPSTPVYLYNNTNVIGGTFTYASSSSKARHTVAIVKYLDPNDLYSEKLEYVEDYDGIARYGYREIEIDGFGCTSKGQARRIGRHIIITEKFELETVSFRIGLEGGIVTPGSLITIKDTYRQLYRAAGRVSAATTNTITLDSSLTIPVGATNILLWVETPTSLNEIIETNTSNTYKPTLTSHAITATAGSSGLTTLTLSSGTFSTTPTNGNIWAVTYTPALAQDNNASTYKIISVSENNSFEYEITALQHYSAKYDEIESYQPITEYKPEPFKLYVPPPVEGFISSTYNGSSYDIKVTWRSEKLIPGTKYKVEVMSTSLNKILASGITNTSYILPNITSGVFYFKIYTLSNISNQFSAPLVLGPHKIKDIMSQNSFSTFYQSSFSDTYITNSWPEDTFANNPIKYELWKSNDSPNLLRSPTGYAIIQSINTTNKTVNILSNSTLQANVLVSPSRHTAEVTIYPYTKYTTTNISIGSIIANTSTSQLVLDTLEKPNINIGDKVMNSTRDTLSNVRAITQTKSIRGRWVSQVSITPAVTSQVSGDFIYIYKGVMGSSFKETQPSGVIKQKTFKALASTSTTNLTASPDVLTPVLAGDIIINRTRSKGSIVSATGTGFLTISPAVTSQVAGDIIAYYQNPTREVRPLKKYAIDWLNLAHGGDSINVLEYDNVDFIPKSNNSIMVNVTLGKCAEVISSSISTGGILNVITYPPMSGITDLNEVIFLNRDEVYTAANNIHIHPTAGVTTTGTNTTTVVTTTTLFTSAIAGDLLVNATRNTCSVIRTVNSSTQVTLAGSGVSTLSIVGQTSGDIVFLISGSSMTSFVELLSYTHPAVLTTLTNTTTTKVVCTGSPFVGTTTSYILYNMTRNNYSAISAVSPNGLTISTPITGQTTNDYVYTFLPTTVTSTQVLAPDGAFNSAKPGDIFYNVTKDTSSTIKDVVTLTGAIDKRVDKLILNSDMTKQPGDHFRIVQGYLSYPVLTASGTTLSFKSVANLEVGSKISTYAYVAQKVGTTPSNTITDTGLTPATTYRYWMRPVNAQNPSISGIWIPSTTLGDAADTTETPFGNYNTSNDNNGSPIEPNAVTRLAPYMDLPPGGVNLDSTANIRLYWEWTGKPMSIDGFNIYFWSSNSSTDVASIDADNDYTSFIANYTAKVNPRLKISTVTLNSTNPTVVTIEPHNLTSGDKVKIGGVKSAAQVYMSSINNTLDADYQTVTVTGLYSFTVTLGTATASTYFAGSGTVTACKYVYQVNNLTANYFYNAWIQPYRVVNTTISDDGLIVGSPKRLYIGV